MTDAGRTALSILKDARLAWSIVVAFIVIGWQARGVLNAHAEVPERMEVLEAVQDHTTARIDTLALRIDASERVQLKTLCLVEELFKPQPDATRCAFLP